MFGGPARVLEIHGGPRDLGEAHGSTFAPMIRKYASHRLELSGREEWSGGRASSDLILEIAEEALPHHQRFSPRLYEEMVAMAEAAGITPAEAVVVGGFTDLVDAIRARVDTALIEDNCTAVLNPGQGYLAQTWDMHASAGEYVFVLKLDPLSGPGAVMQTTAGCLGQMGINEAGIAVGVNNLTAYGRPGVTWPFVVRKMLEQTDLNAAVEVVLEADLAGGHNYLVMGPDGEGVNIEAMPGKKSVARTNGKPLVHTNHCLSTETAAEEGPRLAENVDSSLDRLDIGNQTASDLEAFFASPVIARRSETPEGVATCGAVVMEPGQRRMQAVWGLPGEQPWETFQL